VAGLSAACSLVDQGATPIILEPTPFPSHKVCGEFFSPECLPQLAKWGITFDHKIDNALFCSQNSSLRFSFSQPAGTMSHLAFDQKLLAYAQNKGAILIPEKVVAVRPNEVQTEKRVIPYSQLFIAAGRLPFFPSKSQPIYLGAKAYFSGLKLKAPLMMFSFSGCYVGITEVEKGVYNVALLSNQKELPTLDQLCAKDEGFRDVFEKGHMLFPSWMVAKIPPFGIRNTPPLPNTFFIGDALSAIPPASGAGLSLTLASGMMAADFALRKDPEGFKKEWKKRHSMRIKTAKLLHHCLLRPALFKTYCHTHHFFPTLNQKLFRLTREPFFYA